MLKCSPWAFLPPVYSTFTAAGLWVVYLIAVNGDRMLPLGSHYNTTNGTLYYPYISVAGNFPPASCFFSEVMNLSAFLGLVIGVLRYLQLKPRITRAWLNAGSLVAFVLACFGMTLVGNFQVLTEMTIHNVGTLLTFGLGLLFCWVQSFITVSTNIKNEGWKAGAIRFLLSGCITLCLICHESLIFLQRHVYAAQFQWALVMFFLLFIGTFAIEFRHFTFHIVDKDKSNGSENQTQMSYELTDRHDDTL
ncbi:uncharacterized protein V6R79_005730 [Siganus canaliculatus]